MSNHDLDAYNAKHELVSCKKILVNHVLTNAHVKSNPALVAKIKEISLELEECMAAINIAAYRQERSVNSSTVALDQFSEHYWRLRPEGTTHAILSPAENIVYWGKSGKADAHKVKDIQYIWSLSNWSDQHHVLKKVPTDESAFQIVKFPGIDHIAIRYNGQVYSLPMPNEYRAIYEMLYKQGMDPTPFDAEEGFLHPVTGAFIDAKDALIYAKYIGMLPEDKEIAHLRPAMLLSA